MDHTEGAHPDEIRDGDDTAAIARPEQCDHCLRPVHRDRNGWRVGEDETSDCEASEDGHQVDGVN